MEIESGAQFARLLLSAFGAMVDEVRVELHRAGHPGLTVTNELAMQAIDEGATNAASLARATGVSRQAAAKTIASLEALGYVVRDPDERDARKKSLTVTPQGRRAVSVGAAAFDSIYKRWRKEDEAGSRRAVEALQRLLPASASKEAPTSS